MTNTEENQHSKYDSTSHNESFYKENNNSRKDFFANLNTILVKTGLFAKGAQLISDKISQVQRDTYKLVAVYFLTLIGLVLVLYGLATIITAHYGVEEWSNVIIGGILIVVASLLNLTRGL